MPLGSWTVPWWWRHSRAVLECLIQSWSICWDSLWWRDTGITIYSSSPQTLHPLCFWALAYIFSLLGWGLMVVHSWIAARCVYYCSALITMSFAVKVVPVFWHKSRSCHCVFSPHFGQSRVMYIVTYIAAAVYAWWYISAVDFMHFSIPTLNWYMQRYATFVKPCTCSKSPHTSKMCLILLFLFSCLYFNFPAFS